MMPMLLNHLWQSTLFAVAAGVVALGLRQNQARVRFWVWLAASLKFLLPFGAVAAAGGALKAALGWSGSGIVTAPHAAAAVSQPFGTVVLLLPASPAGTVPGPGGWVWLLGAAWLAGSLLLGIRWLRRWRGLRAITAKAAPASLQGQPVWLTEAGLEPGQFGIWRPRLLLPRGILDKLSPAELAAVLAHERCHARRRDNLWAALHMGCETLFWFHPLVWIIGARLVAERERACDEAVLAAGGDRAAYAGGLLQVCRHYLTSPLPCVAGLSGGELKQRVRAVLEGGWGRQLSRGRMALLGAAGTLALLGPLAAGALLQQAAYTGPLPTAFDAASIKPPALLPRGPGGRRTILVGMKFSPGRLEASYMTLRMLLQQAYGVKRYQVTGPDWMDRERFDIQAETTQPLDEKQMLPLLQAFLMRQFGLQLHRETKQVPVYELTAAKVKMKPAAEEATAAPPEKLQGPPPGRGGNQLAVRTPEGGARLHFGPDGMAMSGAMGMDQLTDLLNMQLDRPVLNRTGLAGRYDINLSYAPTGGGEMRMNGMRPGLGKPGADAKAPGAAPETPAPPAAPSLFTALQQQLGLKLVPATGPVDLVVVDKANPKPLGN